VRYFANQRIDPVSDYVYDSLDQLIKAADGRLAAPTAAPGFQGSTILKRAPVTPRPTAMIAVPTCWN